MHLEDVVAAAESAKANGATRFCMGAAWRGPKQKDLEPVLEMVKAVRALGLETCATLGMLEPGQAEQLKNRRRSITTTTTSIPRPNFTAKSSPRAHTGPTEYARTRPRSRHARMLRRHRRHGRNAPRTAPACSHNSPTLHRSPKAFRSTISFRSKARRCTARRKPRSARICAHYRRRAHHDAEELTCASAPAAAR